MTTFPRSHPTVGQLLAGPVATIEPTATLRQVAERLTADGIGLLVVVGSTGPRGVVTERDLVRAVADDVDLDLERVGDLTSDRPVQVAIDATLEEAAAAMLGAEIRHLLVHDREVVVGVISVRDVLAALVRDAAG